MTSYSATFGLLVGIGGGIPELGADIRLGDVAVSQPTGSSGGVVQYDLQKVKKGEEVERKDFLNKPPKVLLSALSNIQAKHRRKKFRVPAILREIETRNPEMFTSQPGEPGYNYQGFENDKLFDPSYEHTYGKDYSDCDLKKILKRDLRPVPENPKAYYGTIASGDTLVKDATARTELIRYIPGGCIYYKIEAAGLINNLPCLVIRGISDYADSYKNDRWQPYAAATAAAFAKELLGYVPAGQLEAMPKAVDVIKDS
ncbi:uncharacterized protein K452DRAFT_291301 [Aplosporella prunicola CBS 121167]|uniref:Nucleoside phosphorylase domain-containing protein n=1 Tax=Aplosporella prunicola CBS 121167 TaxID=1176127 RepID=A0A6A6B362_9PEZI|nr:uncharacterized protein K452DRAFT_291301 [Aplosporella prunicola CBS 121167]KAF2137695.1 hypothetical protein K452DRAFT_291301 [Aplosporella prunicola CBS 121167]